MMWVVIHKYKMSIFGGYNEREKAERACENLNTITQQNYYMEYVEVR